MKKYLILIIITLVLIGLIYFISNQQERGDGAPPNSNLKGPTGAPFIKGPTEPPPLR